MTTSIKTVEGRARLKPRREPYWEGVRRGCYIGFRKMTAGSAGTWLARWRDVATGKQHHNSLGTLEHLPASDRRDAALKLAEAWFTHLSGGGRSEATDVAGAARAYVDHVRNERGNDAARDAELRFKRWVYDDPKLAPVELTKLQPQHLLTWRKTLAAARVKVPGDEEGRERTRSSINRDLTALRAALNHARRLGTVTSDFAWSEALKPHRNADGRRDIYLDRAQRRKLIGKADEDLAALLKALALVPLRPGALASLSVADFDKRLGTLRIGKDKAGGDRKLPLPPETATFFGEQVRRKLPTAPLLTRADGKRWDKDAWKRPVKAAATAAGLPPATTAYALRHSVITDLVHGGLDTLTVAQLSGTSVAMIERHYGHLRGQIARKALATLAL